ncbi:antibiotic biosynthesis monooxygenase [Papiliotrema laurentii]|uniref:Antibiotic biosynthesis monooxygenase n=1 Tax=Papiliotrema laurentii TaxID=5418 RepID=A0AAD9FQI8_PAPLA|nr:antibiotic biosynthesis monooxygenase [Papiliotrema laurentii]
MAFVNLVTIVVKPGKVDTLLEQLRKIKKDVDTNEPGTKKYHIAQSTENTNEVFLWEEYEDQAALDLHREGQTYKTFRASAADVVESVKIVTSNIIA